MGCVWKRGNTYWIKYRRNGRSYYESTHLKISDENRKAAKALLATRESDIAKGVPVTSSIGKLRYEEARDDFQNDHKVNKRRENKKLEQRIAKHLTPFFKNRRMSEITPADIRAYIVYRQAEVVVTRKARTKRVAKKVVHLPELTKPVTNATINRELTALKRMSQLAIENGRLLTKPSIKLLREDNIRTGFFERDQIASLLTHLPSHLRPVVQFAYITGWRMGSEVLPLQWRQVDMKAGEVRLDPGTTKNREGRLFPFTAELRELFKTLHLEHERLKKQGTIGLYVFHRSNAPNERIKQLRKPWQTACLKAGVPGRIPHDLRRTAVRDMVRAGVPERVVMRLVGHKTRSILDRYNIVSPGDFATAARQLDGAVTTIVTNAGQNA